jgi:hypothetical protein
MPALVICGLELVSRTRCSAIAVHRRSGIVPDSAFVTIPGLPRTTSLRHSASKTRVNALLVLRCARETMRESIAGITDRHALAKSPRSHYVRPKSSLDNPLPPAVGREAISL